MSRRTIVIAAALGAILLIAAPASAWVLPSAHPMPDGLERPVIRSVELSTPKAHNNLLEADLVIRAKTDKGIRRYEYRWNGGTIGSIHRTPVTNPVVSYATILPNTRYGLQVRAVDRFGWTSEWFDVWTGFTPSVPNIIVAGDSVASGYTRQWFTGDATCRDQSYAYGASVVSSVANTLPDAWYPTYVNVAWPGAGVGAMVNGGSDSCSDHYAPQILEIEKYADPDTWNVVVITAGINSTNWVDVVMELTKDTTLSFTASGDQEACRRAVNEKWNIQRSAESISQHANRIVTDLDRTTNASIYWTSYYSIVGSRFAPAWSPVGDECTGEMEAAMGRLHTALRTGIGDGATWVDLSDVEVGIQKWAGWPHPNPDGHRAIGEAIADAITG